MVGDRSRLHPECLRAKGFERNRLVCNSSCNPEFATVPCIALIHASNFCVMNRPKGLALTVALMSLSNAMLWATFQPMPGTYSVRRFLMFTVVICIGFVVIWFYWKGKNWARIGVLLFSGSSILNLFTWKQVAAFPGFQATPAHALLAARAVLGVFLLYYLNTRLLLEFFCRDTKETGPKYGWGRILYGLWMITSNIQPHLPQIAIQDRSNGIAPTPPTIANAVMILIGISVLAWGVRAGIVPYDAERARS